MHTFTHFVSFQVSRSSGTDTLTQMCNTFGMGIEHSMSVKNYQRAAEQNLEEYTKGLARVNLTRQKRRAEWEAELKASRASVRRILKHLFIFIIFIISGKNSRKLQRILCR